MGSFKVEPIIRPISDRFVKRSL